METLKCYMCDKDSTSREHVPPDCFFPPGHRIDLITVPSCDDHNSRKSKDDEYVHFIIAASSVSNPHGENYFRTKGIRAIERSGGLIAAVFQGVQPIKMPDGKETGSAKVDLPRWERFFKHLANAIYFHDFEKPWTGGWVIINDSLHYPQTNPAKDFEKLKEMLLKAKFVKRETSNPEIFRYYHFGPGKDHPVYEFTFYEGFVVHAVST